jgi:hypothetical protein
VTAPDRSGARILAIAAKHNVLPAADLPAVLEAIGEARNGPGILDGSAPSEADAMPVLSGEALVEWRRGEPGAEERWNALMARKAVLVDRKIDGEASEQELAELDELKRLSSERRNRECPYPLEELERIQQDIERRNAHRDPSPPNIPLAIGSTWTGPDGTVYASEVEGRRALRALRNQVMLETGERQFIDGDREEWCAACGKHISRHYGGVEYRCDPRNDAAPASELDALRDRVVELEAELDEVTKDRDAYKGLATRWEAELGEAQGDALRIAAELGATQAALDTARTGSNNYRDAYLAYQRWASSLCGRLGSLASSDETYRETVAMALGEARSQLASAHAACEASRNERDRLREAFLEIARATGAHADVIPSVLADHAVTVIRHDAAVTARISSLVATHIVRTTGTEPALEGLGRIELALVEGGKAIARVKARAKPAHKAKGKRKAGG